VTEVLALPTVDAQGVLVEVTLRLGDSGSARVELNDQGVVVEVHGDDYLDCLMQIRERLEADGRLLCCQGARADVWPSGMLRQFSDGRQAYVLDREQPSLMVDVFAPADPAQVVSISRQRDAVYAFHGRPRPNVSE
jgi:hypothetical protein